MHGDFLKLIEKKEKKRSSNFARFLELLRDPDFAADFDSYLGVLLEQRRNGDHASAVPLKPRQAKPRPTAKKFKPPVGFKKGNGIREAICELKLPNQFTVDDVLAMLVSRNFAFGSSNHRAAVRDAIFVLSKGDKAVFRKAAEGINGTPNLYERVE